MRFSIMYDSTMKKYHLMIHSAIGIPWHEDPKGCCQCLSGGRSCASFVRIQVPLILIAAYFACGGILLKTARPRPTNAPPLWLA